MLPPQSLNNIYDAYRSAAVDTKSADNLRVRNSSLKLIFLKPEEEV